MVLVQHSSVRLIKLCNLFDETIIVYHYGRNFRLVDYVTMLLNKLLILTIVKEHKFIPFIFIITESSNSNF